MSELEKLDAMKDEAVLAALEGVRDALVTLDERLDKLAQRQVTLAAKFEGHRHYWQQNGNQIATTPPIEAKHD